MIKEVKIKFLKLHKDAQIPVFAKVGDAGFDIYALENKTIKKGTHELVRSGIASEFPHGYFVSIRDRSGLAVKFGIHTLAGVIDSGYRGEWGIVLANLGEKIYKVEKGERIAQGVLQVVPKVKIMEVKKLKDSQRGTGGFGSTGKK
jgi:dUTP pyrophosphatase